MKIQGLKLIATLCGVLMIGQVMSARPLSAREALQMYKEQGLQAREQSVSDYRLAYTEISDVTDAPGVYVFVPGEGDGFVILSADDAIGSLVLGYSDSSKFDAENMPPALCDALKYYACCVGGWSSATEMRKVPAKKKREPIAPLCYTKWNQDAPYNNQCPMLRGGRAVTGCVATAMAQVMKVHQWPEQGTGYHSYVYDYEGQQMTESLDFSSITFDWENMLDVYNGASNAKQKRAVATLMYSCGVAAEMIYSPEASGAYPYVAAKGMIRNLGYDKGMRYLMADWFDNEDWCNLIYGELAEGRPVMLSGYNDSWEGHEFVCDGYNGLTDYFHINWGWGGYCDGYFTLQDLNPNGSGIGGGSDGSGFNLFRDVVCGIQKQVEGHDYAPVMLTDGFSTSSTSYTRTPGTWIEFNRPIYSYALGDVTYLVGFKLVDSDGNVSYVPMSQSYTFGSFSGWGSYYMSPFDFPEGEYDVYPAFKTDQTEWQDMYYDHTQGDIALHFNVSDTTIDITKQGDEPQEDNIVATLNYISPTDANPNDGAIYPGHTYDFNWTVTTKCAYETSTFCVIANDFDWGIIGMSDDVEINVSDASSVDVKYTITVGDDVTPGQYNVCILYEGEDGYYVMNNAYVIEISRLPEGEVKVVDVVFKGNEFDPDYPDCAVLQRDAQEITVTLECTRAPWSDGVRLVFFNDGIRFADTAPVDVQLDTAGATVNLVFTGPWDGIEYGQVYGFVVCGNYDTLSSKFYYFKVSPGAGIEDAILDIDAEYYNLQGLKVDRPQHGLYIRKADGRVVKVFIK